MKLEGRNAIVTAAGRGLGRAIAECLADAGANVAVNSFGEETTAATTAAVESRGVRALAFPGDITDPTVMLAMIERTRTELGSIDILVNNVGAGPKSASPPDEGPLGPIAAMWDALYAQNLKATVLMSEAVAEHMTANGSGKIINISSIAGKTSFPPRMLALLVPPAYGAMKAALVSYTQSLADRLGEHNINVNAVCPGIVYTDAWKANAERIVKTLPEFEGMTADEWFDGIFRDDYPTLVPRTPLRRPQTAEDIGNAVVFLASDAAANITGQSLMVDGGMVKL
jgi:gluconate 5-dehydrogenase